MTDEGGLDGGYGGGFGGHDDGAYQLSPVGEEVRLSPTLCPASLLLSIVWQPHCCMLPNPKVLMIL